MDKKLNITQTLLKGVYLISPNSFEDERGSFTRLFCEKEIKSFFNFSIKQINHSINKQMGTTRGLHFQYEPNAESKIIRCINGKIFDVVVDIRQNSPTFLKCLAIELSEKNKLMLYIPKGFAHGFQTLKNNTEIIYLHSENYNPKNEGSLNIKDPLLNISWPLEIKNLSKRDSEHKFLDKDFKGIKINEL